MLKKMRKTPKLYRQGDVLVERIADRDFPDEREAIAPDQGRVVLAYGEVTGHAHAIPAEDAVFVQHSRATRGRTEGNVTYLETARAVPIRHEEHAPIELPPGKYRVIRQREWDDEQDRIVAD